MNRLVADASMPRSPKPASSSYACGWRSDGAGLVTLPSHPHQVLEVMELARTDALNLEEVPDIVIGAVVDDGAGGGLADKGDADQAFPGGEIEIDGERVFFRIA